MTIKPGTLLRTKQNSTVVLHQNNNFDDITTDPCFITISSTDRFAMYIGSTKKWKRDSKFTYNTKLTYIHSFLGSCGKVVNCTSCYSIDEWLNDTELLMEIK
jgi:hypothetical protein